MRMGALSVTLLFSLTVVGCVRRNGRNADCKWPAEISGHFADARHLSADAEFAEDLAIRYADTHHGLRTPNYVSREAYAAGRDLVFARGELPDRQWPYELPRATTLVGSASNRAICRCSGRLLVGCRGDGAPDAIE